MAVAYWYRYDGNLVVGDGADIIRILDANNIVRDVRTGGAVELTQVQLDAIDDNYEFTQVNGPTQVNVYVPDRVAKLSKSESDQGSYIDAFTGQPVPIELVGVPGGVADYLETLEALGTKVDLSLLPTAIANALAADGTVAAAAANAANTALSQVDLLKASSVPSDSILFSIVDSTGKRSFVEVGPDGKPTPESAKLIASALVASVSNVLADAVAARVGDDLGFTVSLVSTSGSGVAFAIVDSQERRSWIEMTSAGKPTPESAAIITQAVSPLIAPSLLASGQLGIENFGNAAASGVSFAVVDAAGRRSWVEADEAGMPTSRVVDILKARVGTGPSSVGLTELKTEVSSRLAPLVPVVYVPQISGGNLYVTRNDTGQRTRLSTGANPRNPATKGDGWVTWTDDNGDWARPADTSVIALAQHPVPQIACWGDSYTRGAGSSDNGATQHYPGYLATALGVSVFKGGYGGRASTDIATFQGGVQPVFTAAGNSIPASGTVALTKISPATSFTDSGGPDQTDWPGTFMGVTGTLRHTYDGTGGTWSFIRTGSGSITSVPGGGAPFICNVGDSYRNNIAVFWAGRNNIQKTAWFNVAQDIVRDTASMVAWLSVYSKRFLVMGVANAPGEGIGTAGYNEILAINAQLSATYGARYLDIRRELIDNGLSSLGLTPTSNDLADIAADTPPRQLYSGDVFHPNDNGYHVVANKVAATITSKGWLL